MRIGDQNQGVISVHIDGVSGNNAGQNAQKAGTAGKKSVQAGVFFAGGNMQTNDTITQKREQAQQKALRLIKNVFAAACKVDEGIAERRANISRLQEESAKAEAQIGKFEEEKAKLKEAYGIEDDSQEQKELQLLEKRADAQASGSAVQLTPEEQKLLKEIDERGLTEYQQRCLDLHTAEQPYKQTIADNEIQIWNDTSAIRDTKLEILKTRPMLEATQAAEEIMQQASDEIISQLMAEGKEYLDEKAEEAAEKAKEQKEKEEEQEEQIEAVKEKKEQIEQQVENTREKVHESNVQEVPDMDAQTEIALELDDVRTNAQREVQKMLAKLGLLEEDLKGSVVDENL